MLKKEANSTWGFHLFFKGGVGALCAAWWMIVLIQEVSAPRHCVYSDCVYHAKNICMSAKVMGDLWWLILCVNLTQSWVARFLVKCWSLGYNWSAFEAEDSDRWVAYTAWRMSWESWESRRQRERPFLLPISHCSPIFFTQIIPYTVRVLQHAHRPPPLHGQFRVTELFPLHMCACICVHTCVLVDFVPLGGPNASIWPLYKKTNKWNSKIRHCGFWTFLWFK